MSALIVQTSENICLVGGAPVPKPTLDEALSHAPVLVAADGGAAQCLAAGYVPRAVIGDMDSLSESDRAHLDKGAIYQVAEQDSTDFDKALRNLSCPVAVGVGFTGGRIDHELAAYHTLLRRADKACVLVGETEIVFLCPSTVQVPTQEGDVVSLFPLVACSGESQGLQWPIDGLCLSPSDRIGTSNRATGAVRLSVDQAGLLVILPRRHLGPVVQSLAAVPPLARWPARA